jgi:TonB family protein
MLAAIPFVLLLQMSPQAGTNCPPSSDEFSTALCMGDELLRRGEASAKDVSVRTAAWRRAAEAYRRAANVARDPVMKKKALELLVQIYDPEHLARPQDAEPVLRELFAASPNELAPMFRLSKLQEGQNMIDAAESTLMAARQQHPDSAEPYRELSEFYGRRAAAIETATAMEKQPELVGRPDPSNPAGAPQPEPGTPDENGVYSVGGAIAPPAVVSSVPANAPASASGSPGVDALVCEIVVDEAGRVRDARVMQSGGGLDDYVLAAVKQWRYAPTMVDGRAVPVRLTVAVPFAK